MKRFTLIIEQDFNSIVMDGTNEGFNALELIALLDLKKMDINEQFRKQENFTHHRVVNVDGEWHEIREGE